MSNFSIITPHAAFLIWNYTDRLGSSNLEGIAETKIDRLIISTFSLKAISTSKTKTAPSGTFQVSLAPTRNWVQVIAPCSWCTILMSREA